MIKDTLDDYCLLYGQLVNYDNSAAYFSKGTYNIKKRKLANILGVKLMTGNDRCLGNPLIMNRNRNSHFQSLVVKIESKIMSG